MAEGALGEPTDTVALTRKRPLADVSQHDATHRREISAQERLCAAEAGTSKVSLEKLGYRWGSRPMGSSASI